MSNCVIGIDVGTGSARAGVFDQHGTCLGVGKHPISLFVESGTIAEHSSANIWQAVCQSVRMAMQEAEVSPDAIRGIGFDAACSLVAVDASVNADQDPARDVIVWMDHRAVAEAEEINAGDHAVLRYVGNRISPEMQTPKLLWLKRHLPEAYASATHFMDLVDWLTWKATGDTSRSACTLTCKWTYLAHENRWDSDYFHAIGLGDLADEGFIRIGTEVCQPGEALGTGLTTTAANDLGLSVGTIVGTGLIDAHAGGVGTLGATAIAGDVATRLGYVFGTSACTMTSSIAPVFVPGIWGPYSGAMVPGLWLNEGGQSAAGAAIDHLIAMHPAREQAKQQADKAGHSIPEYLSAQAMRETSDLSAIIQRADGVVVIPDFNGNRAPFADPHARGIIAGLGLETSIDSLVTLYVAGLSGIACGLRQIIETQQKHGLTTEAIVVSGGAGADPLAQQIIADTTGLPVLVPEADEPVLLGAAMLGAVACGLAGNLSDAMKAMSRFSRTVSPSVAAHSGAHSRRFDQYVALQAAMRSE
ncbi:MAG: FGGY-family carbohydrate kinase [Stappiaceae bacterium]